jgi:NADH-quinone oxidoreductase subunit L
MWKEATVFSVLNEISVYQVQEYHSVIFLVFCLCLVIASLGKSAQFPFYNWPAKAMEGPTPSSAIFYGALSIHAGLLLLIRTEVIWSSNFWASGLIVTAGAVTFVLSFLQKKVQTNIKGRIAYAITSQIGLMYILLGLGFTNVVFVYMLFHAVIRCFQILISSSIVADSDLSNNKNVIAKIEKRKTFMEFLSMRLRSTLYLYTSMDFGLNYFHWKWIVSPLKILIGGRYTGWVLLVFLLLFSAFPFSSHYYFISGTSVLLAMRSLFYHRSPFHMVLDVMLCLSGVLISFAFIDHHALTTITDYLYPVLPAILTVLGISYLFKDKDVRHFHGEGSKHTVKANLFFISFMVISGMPISSAFVAEDIILESLVEHRPILAVMTLLILMLVGIILSKVYVRLFMGRAPMLT